MKIHRRNFNVDNMYCGHIKRGDIILCELHEREEIPMVALQDNALNETMATILCVPIEPLHKGREIYINEVAIDAKESGLGKPGICYPYYMMPIDRRSIVAKKGELEPGTLRDLYKALDLSLGRFRD